MARIFFVHWNKDEAMASVKALRAAGHTVSYHWDSGEDAWKLLKDAPPDVLVVSLDRLPSHGRRVAAVTTETKRLRELLVIFVDGEPDKVAVARSQFPKAWFCTAATLLDLLKHIPKFQASPQLPTRVRAARPVGVAPSRATQHASSAGYSGKPLAAKLGLQPGTALHAVGAPSDYPQWLEPLPGGVSFRHLSKDTDIVHHFAFDKADLLKALKVYRKKLRSDAILWVSWPKKASKMSTNITEDTIRELALPLGFVDTKVCAVSDVWSGLKLVVRKELR